MSRRSYPVTPDGAPALEVDRRAAPVGLKKAGYLAPESFTDRQERRSGLVELDAMTERMSGLTRAQKDKERVFPRERNQPLSHPAMQRPLPGPDEPRLPFSSRQKKARSRSRYAAAADLPRTQAVAQKRLMTTPQVWDRVNGQLAEHVGDPEGLSPADRKLVAQIDRSIQTAERHNDRGHVIYTNAEMPAAINHSNIYAWASKTFTPGAVVAFDRYTVGTHQLHETSALQGDSAPRTLVCEIQTRRGAYLGHSDSMDDTTHLLPRGMRLQIVGITRAEYRTPDGGGGERLVLQLRDVTQNTTTERTTS